MEDVFQVAAQLVFATVQRIERDQAVARGGVAAIARQWDFAAMQTAVVGQCRLWCFVTAAVTIGDFVRQVAEWVVNITFIRQPAAHDGVVGFVQTVRCDVSAAQARSFGIECEEQDTAGRAVKTVDGIGFAAYLLL